MQIRTYREFLNEKFRILVTKNESNIKKEEFFTELSLERVNIQDNKDNKDNKDTKNTQDVKDSESILSSSILSSNLRKFNFLIISPEDSFTLLGKLSKIEEFPYNVDDKLVLNEDEKLIEIEKLI